MGDDHSTPSIKRIHSSRFPDSIPAMELTPAHTEKTKGEPISADGRLETTANHAHENPMNKNPLQGDILQEHTNIKKVIDLHNALLIEKKCVWIMS